MQTDPNMEHLETETQYSYNAYDDVYETEHINDNVNRNKYETNINEINDDELQFDLSDNERENIKASDVIDEDRYSKNDILSEKNDDDDDDDDIISGDTST